MSRALACGAHALALAWTLGLLLAPPLARAEAGWPSRAQVELVEQRRASFPVATLVESIDWYTPREQVPGGRRDPLPLRPAAERRIDPAALQAALAIARAHDSYALLVWHAGALELEHYGERFGPQSRYDTASMHKAVLALLVGAAVADGAIRSVDDPLGRYVPDAPAALAAVPLRALLEMSSGLTTPPLSNDAASPYWQSIFGDDLKTALRHWPLQGRPFEAFQYANANTQYLAWAIENATGMRYAQYLARRLWQPLGAGEARLWLDREGGSARAFCCLQASARDWLRVGRLLLDQGRVDGRLLVPEGWVARMSAPTPANPNFGWQLWRGSPHAPQRSYGPAVPVRIPAAQPFAADDVIYIDGSGGQRVYVVPSRQLVIVRIGAASRRWDDSELPNALLAGIR